MSAKYWKTRSDFYRWAISLGTARNRHTAAHIKTGQAHYEILGTFLRIYVLVRCPSCKTVLALDKIDEALDNLDDRRVEEPPRYCPACGVDRR